jgi:hypothetical protein
MRIVADSGEPATKLAFAATECAGAPEPMMREVVVELPFMSITAIPPVVGPSIATKSSAPYASIEPGRELAPPVVITRDTVFVAVLMTLTVLLP